MIVAIVGIVAMVGLIMLFMNGNGEGGNLAGQAIYYDTGISGSYSGDLSPSTDTSLFFEDKALADRASDFDEKKDGIDSSIGDGDVSKVTLGICGDGICSEGEEISCSADCKLLVKAE